MQIKYLALLLCILLTGCAPQSVPELTEQALAEVPVNELTEEYRVYTVDGDVIPYTAQVSSDDILGVTALPYDLVCSIYQDTLDKLQTGRVMLIEVDGLGYQNLQDSDAHYLKSLDTEKLLSVMPSVSEVNLAAILTGETPAVNGITDKKAEEVLVPDIFEVLNQQGKSYAYIEGNGKLCNFSIDPIYSYDLNVDGSTDDNVYANGIKHLDNDFVYIHFHGYDELAHIHGYEAPETAQKLLEIEAYIRQLAEQFEGSVFVVSDHGFHGDNHGTFAPRDMIVPYITVTLPNA